MTLLRPLPSGMMVVVGWMMVPLAERSTTGRGAKGCFLAAAAGIAVAARITAKRTLNAVPGSGRTTDDMVPRSLCHQI
jgi:hypothetical protein